MGGLIYKFLSKQTDNDKILHIIQRKVLKGTHLPAEIKEVQAGYLHSPYFKEIYQYLSQNKLPHSKLAIKRIRGIIRKIHFARLPTVQDLPRKGDSCSGNTRSVCRQNNNPIS